MKKRILYFPIISPTCIFSQSISVGHFHINRMKEVKADVSWKHILFNKMADQICCSKAKSFIFMSKKKLNSFFDI